MVRNPARSLACAALLELCRRFASPARPSIDTLRIFGFAAPETHMTARTLGGHDGHASWREGRGRGGGMPSSPIQPGSGWYRGINLFPSTWSPNVRHRCTPYSVLRIQSLTFSQHSVEPGASRRPDPDVSRPFI